jgi:hypothetical protein
MKRWGVRIGMYSFIEARTDRHDAAGAPGFLIVHRFWRPGTVCLPGEEVVGAWLDPDGPQLRLPLALRLLFDHLAHHRWLAQSAAQIEAAMRNDAFFVRHAANSRVSHKMTRRMSRSGIKVYIARIREALQIAFDEAGIDLNATNILITERTVGGEVGYKLHARVRWAHIR